MSGSLKQRAFSGVRWTVSAIVTRVVRALLSARLPPVLLLCLEIVAAAAAFLGTVHVFGPAVFSDARALLREVMRPGKTADTGIAT